MLNGLLDWAKFFHVIWGRIKQGRLYWFSWFSKRNFYFHLGGGGGGVDRLNSESKLVFSVGRGGEIAGILTLNSNFQIFQSANDMCWKLGGTTGVAF